MNVEISETIQELSMQILEILAQRKFISAGRHAHKLQVKQLGDLFSVN